MTLQLFYFPLTGRAEVIRLICLAKGAEFTETAPDYQAMKADKDNFPFGQVPRLVDGDVNLVQSNAIVRYLARKFDMYGKTNVEMATVDMLLDAVEDFRGCWAKYVYGAKASDEEKPGFMAQFKTHAENINRLVAKGPGPFLFGAEPCVADFAIYDICWLVKRLDGDFLESFEALKAVFQAVEAIPAIKKHIEESRHERVSGNGLG